MFLRLGCCVLTALILAGCATPPPAPPRYPELRFTNAPPIRLDVSRITIESPFQPKLTPPHVEEQFPVHPLHALEIWARDRFQAANPASPRTARIVFSDASVVELDLPRTQGLAGVFTRDQAQRYDETGAVTVEILDESGRMLRRARASAVCSTSVAEGITLNDRDEAWYELNNQLVQDLNREMERQIDAAFSPFRR